MTLGSYPMSNIVAPGEHDCLNGRGGHTIHWSGNIKFRALVEKHRERYHAASRADKGKVVAEVVQLWRQMTPPGRFLALTDPKLGDASPWHDIGDKLAQKKTAKRLREALPELTGTISSCATSSDDDSSIELTGNKRTVRRVSNDFAEKSAKRIRFELSSLSGDDEQIESPMMKLFLANQQRDVEKPRQACDTWVKEPVDSIFATDDDGDFELFDEAELEPININSFNDTGVCNSAVGSDTTAFSSLFQNPNKLVPTNMVGGGSALLLKEIAISIPSAACLTEVSLFD